ncbi:hypothetical protein, partial [Nostoc sp. CHAB 5715]|uniref:hypothetical protein n=1 Tax=Nostoc sp. CHAB 5715 TaxID=2780400 RepID=UPI001E378131
KKNQQLLTANLELAKLRNTLFPLIGGLANVSSLVIIWLGAARYIFIVWAKDLVQQSHSPYHYINNQLWFHLMMATQQTVLNVSH